MASLKSAMKGGQRMHRERSQLDKRKHLGLLEKKKDYVTRARDFHKKEKVIKKLQQKARDKNPDEFYYRMITEKTKEGVHTVQKQTKYTGDQMKLMKTQDMNYVTLKKTIESKKIEKLQKRLHHIGEFDGEERQHIFFVDTKKEEEEFCPAKRLSTLPELVYRAHNRPTLSTLHSSKMEGD